jgi:hypothetical protein
MMTAQEIGNELVALCRQGKNMEAIERLYSPAIESVEALDHPQIGHVQTGLDAVKGKNRWWADHHQIHKAEAGGPFVNGDRFIVHFTYDVTPKQTGRRMTMTEAGLYQVKDGKIAREEFFYTMCK